MTVSATTWFETPELTGQHVTLTPLEVHHAAGVLEAATDDQSFRWMSFERPRTIEQAEALIQDLVERPATVAWALIDERTDNVAGFTTFYDIDPHQRSVAMGSTWIGPRYQRTGVNTETKLMLLTHAFDSLGAVRVVWHVDIFNTESKNAVERLGAQREGILRKHKLRRDGSWRDTVLYSMIDEEWSHSRVVILGVLRPR